MLGIPEEFLKDVDKLIEESKVEKVIEYKVVEINNADFTLENTLNRYAIDGWQLHKLIQGNYPWLFTIIFMKEVYIQ
jgi:hypothetical protein